MPEMTFPTRVIEKTARKLYERIILDRGENDIWETNEYVRVSWIQDAEYFLLDAFNVEDDRSTEIDTIVDYPNSPISMSGTLDPPMFTWEIHENLPEDGQ